MQVDRNENFFLELLKFVSVSLLIVIPVRLWIVQPFIVSGSSMDPTFTNGDYLIVDELSYRWNEPKQGDVIIFHHPRDKEDFLIKRIIGVPGDTVFVTPTGVSVAHMNESAEQLQETYVVNTGNIVRESITLGPNQYFVMGDNRPVSSDSRFWGPVSRDDIVGRTLVRLLPLSELDMFPGMSGSRE